MADAKKSEPVLDAKKADAPAEAAKKAEAPLEPKKSDVASPSRKRSADDTAKRSPIESTLASVLVSVADRGVLAGVLTAHADSEAVAVAALEQLGPFLHKDAPNAAEISAVIAALSAHPDSEAVARAAAAALPNKKPKTNAPSCNALIAALYGAAWRHAAVASECIGAARGAWARDDPPVVTFS